MKNNIHKGHYYHNDCGHTNDEYKFSILIKMKSGNKLPFDVYLLNGENSFNKTQQMCLRMGNSGNYISTDLHDVVRGYLIDKTSDWDY
jgi:hypothetical protein